MTAVARALGAMLALAAVFALARASAVSLTTYDPGTSILRLTWSARPERVEDCRSLSDQELAKLPAHMRQSIVCEGTTAPYHLQVVRDGTVLVDEIVRAGGFRHDRPLYVFKDVPVPPREASILVRFERIDAMAARPAESGTASTPRGDRARDDEQHANATNQDRRRRDDEDQLRRREVAPGSLTFQQRVRFTPGRVIVVTYDSDRRTLAAIESSSPR